MYADCQILTRNPTYFTCFRYSYIFYFHLYNIWKQIYCSWLFWTISIVESWFFRAQFCWLIHLVNTSFWELVKNSCLFLFFITLDNKRFLSEWHSIHHFLVRKNKLRRYKRWHLQYAKRRNFPLYWNKNEWGNFIFSLLELNLKRFRIKCRIVAINLLKQWSYSTIFYKKRYGVRTTTFCRWQCWRVERINKWNFKILNGIWWCIFCLSQSKIEHMENKFSNRQIFQCRDENWRIYNSSLAIWNLHRWERYNE